MARIIDYGIITINLYNQCAIAVWFKSAIKLVYQDLSTGDLQVFLCLVASFVVWSNYALLQWMLRHWAALPLILLSTTELESVSGSEIY